MSNSNSMLDELINPITDGAKMAGSGEAAELLVKTFHKILGSKKPAWAKVLQGGGNDFRHIQAGILAAAVKLMVMAWPNLPQAKNALKISDNALRFESAMVLKPFLAHASEFMESLVANAAHLLPGGE